MFGCFFRNCMGINNSLLCGAGVSFEGTGFVSSSSISSGLISSEAGSEGSGRSNREGNFGKMFGFSLFVGGSFASTFELSEVLFVAPEGRVIEEIGGKVFCFEIETTGCFTSCFLRSGESFSSSESEA